MRSLTDGQMEKFWKLAKKGVIHCANFQPFLEDPNKFLGQASGQDTYLIEVNYDLTLAQMIEAGKYDWANSDINEDNFPFDNKGQVQVEAVLVHLGKLVSSEDVITEFDRQDLRPATLPELLAFGAKHPELQKQFPIVALGSVWRDSGGSRRVPCLGWDGSGRYLNLSWFELDWGEDYRFLAVRK